jgi:hypothetical protein
MTFDYGSDLIRRLNETEVDVRWPPAYEDMSPREEDRPLLEDITKQRTEDRD